MGSNEHRDEETTEYPVELGAWVVPGPPVDFTDRVMERLRQTSVEVERQHHDDAPRRRVGATAAAAFALAAALVLLLGALLFGVLDRDAEASGTLAASERTTRELGAHALVVAERGTALSWSHGDDGTQVQQTRGRAFYRVDKGQTFAVSTPAGVVTVQGTCFEVEIDEMNASMMKGASMGAALAAVVTVTVYEGRVVLGNDGGEVELSAGERARASAGQRPHSLDRSDGDAVSGALASADVGQLRAENRRLQRELEALTSGPSSEASAGEGHELRASRRDANNTASLDPIAKAKACADDGACDPELWTDPTVEQLQELARCGRLLVDSPSFLRSDDQDVSDPFDARRVEATGLSDEELAAVARTSTEFRDEVDAQFQALLLEMGVGAEFLAKLSPGQRMKLAEGMFPSITDQLSRERAGLAVPPPIEQQSPEERALRIWSELGTRYEERLATVIGEEAAAELRRAGGGWSSRSSFGSDCEE